MYKQKFLLFTTGGGSDDPVHMDHGEAAMYNANDLRSVKPVDPRTVELIFSTASGTELVLIGVQNATQNKVIRAIGQAISSSNSSVIAVADIDSGRLIDSTVWSCEILGKKTEAYTITNTVPHRIYPNQYSSLTSAKIDSLSICNYHASGSAAVDLYLVDVTRDSTTSIATTGVLINEAAGYAVGKTVLTVDTTSATTTLFPVYEKIFNSSGTYIGEIASVGSTTQITLGDGVQAALANNDALYTGNRYNILKSLNIPPKTTVVLDSVDVDFDQVQFSLFAQTTAGSLSFITRY